MCKISNNFPLNTLEMKKIQMNVMNMKRVNITFLLMKMKIKYLKKKNILTLILVRSSHEEIIVKKVCFSTTIWKLV